MNIKFSFLAVAMVLVLNNNQVYGSMGITKEQIKTKAESTQAAVEAIVAKAMARRKCVGVNGDSSICICPIHKPQYSSYPPYKDRANQVATKPAFQG